MLRRCRIRIKRKKNKKKKENNKFSHSSKIMRIVYIIILSSLRFLKMKEYSLTRNSFLYLIMIKYIIIHHIIIHINHHIIILVYSDNQGIEIEADPEINILIIHLINILFDYVL